LNPAESHAWFRAASDRTVRAINAASEEAAEDWRLRLHDYQERVDLRTVAPHICPYLAALTAARVAIELGVIVAMFPEEPRHVLRPSWE
jgi:hypothetical protein